MPDERGIAVVGALPIEQRLLRVAAEASRVELADHLVPSSAGVALVTTTTGLYRTHSMEAFRRVAQTFPCIESRFVESRIALLLPIANDLAT